MSDGVGSGVSVFTPTLDGATTVAGHGLQSGQAIHLLTELSVGMHTFTIVASDNLQNSGNATVTFEVLVTPESIKEDVNYYLAAGDFKNKGMANSLLAKLNSAAHAIERDHCHTAINIYNAFIHELNAQSGKGVDPTAAAIMIADAEYLIANCDRFVPGAIQAAPAAAMGDFTKDGVINGADYAVWRKTQGHHVPKHSGADGDGDGLIGQGDFNVWRAHFGMTLPATVTGRSEVAAAAVVEATSLTRTASVAAATSVAPQVELVTLGQASSDVLPRPSESTASLTADGDFVPILSSKDPAKTRRLPAAPTIQAGTSTSSNELLIADLAAAKVDQQASELESNSHSIDRTAKNAMKIRKEALELAFDTLERFSGLLSV